ncbi:uncharacterized protein TNCV_2480351 [Trichonephila clavipes]|nr:uncharacterized protein TNCV_2480351 [Trichonephila clavipes]
MMMIRHNLIGLNLCSWNANGILNKIMELKIFVEKYSPDLILMQETHLRPKHNINIPNYIYYRNDRNTDENAYGGTLILIRRNIPHYNLPTPAHRGYDRSSHPPPTSIPFLLFQSTSRLDRTRDCSLMISNNSSRPTVTVIFGNLNASHNEWNCSVNSTRGNQLKPSTDNLNLTIAYPNSPTRFGYRTSNTLDIAVINNFNFPFTIDSIPELSSDHNPVFLNFSLTTPIHSDNSRAVTTCWSEFRNNLKKSVRLAQANLKKALKKHSQQSWETRLESLNTTNSLWQSVRSTFVKNAPLYLISSGLACSDDQKANLLAITLKDNFTENERPDGDYPIDNRITSTLENLFSHPPPLPINPTDPDEVLSYVKTLSNNKAPASVGNNNTLSDSQKLQYLKLSVKGEAATLLQSIQITNDNYKRAWNALTKCYENEAEIIHATLNKLVSQPILKQESASGLRKLIDTTQQCIDTLQTLKQPVEYWDILIVFLLSGKLDSETLRVWTLEQTNKQKNPSFSEFKSFVLCRATVANGANELVA